MDGFTGLRIEVSRVADLDRARGAMNGRVIVDGILMCYLLGIHRCVGLALMLVSVIYTGKKASYLPS